MKRLKRALFLIAFSTVLGTKIQAFTTQSLGFICHNPSSACRTSYEFQPYQLPFKIAQKLTFGRTYKSVLFYAVILESKPARNVGEECGQIEERVRVETQAIFPEKKVFASHFGCAEELVLYSNVNQEFNFMAVYAGISRTEANRTLNKVRLTRLFPSANIRRMQVLLEFST